MGNLNNLLNNWTGAADFDQLTVVELEQLVEDAPFNAIMQLLLCKKYQLTHSPLYEAQIKKTRSFFPSALQLHHCLHDSEETGINQAISTAKLNAVLIEQVQQFKEPLATELQKLEHEQFIGLQKDYFAEQGIEIDLAKLPQDNFTKQLRSFTAWLKVLKQADFEQEMPQIAEEQEKMITDIAEKANKTADIITESMAEIWAKQGNKRKAIDTYSKLSFIFPEKSVYFASQIEQLKQKK